MVDLGSAGVVLLLIVERAGVDLGIFEDGECGTVADDDEEPRGHPPGKYIPRLLMLLTTGVK